MTSERISRTLLRIGCVLLSMSMASLGSAQTATPKSRYHAACGRSGGQRQSRALARCCAESQVDCQKPSSAAETATEAQRSAAVGQIVRVRIERARTESIGITEARSETEINFPAGS